ncbi:MAG: hypothetical protein ABI224_02155 [Acetobacteraceae bacterium]
MISRIGGRLAELGLALPPPLQPPPGLVLPFDIPVEIEAEVAIG